MNKNWVSNWSFVEKEFLKRYANIRVNKNGWSHRRKIKHTLHLQFFLPGKKFNSVNLIQKVNEKLEKIYQSNDKILRINWLRRK
jgi:hypothetical protein